MKAPRSKTTLLHPPRHLFLWLARAITLCPFKRKEIKGGSEARRDYFLTALTIKTLFMRNGWVCILEWTFSSLRQDARCREKLLETRFVAPCSSSTTRWSRRVRVLRFSTPQRPRRGSRLLSRRRRPDEASDTDRPWPAAPRYKHWHPFMCTTPRCKRKWRTTSYSG